MTSKEIMQASLLDILFEHHNKAYGAYLLRKTYDRRLMIALLTGLTAIGLFLLVSFVGRNKQAEIRDVTTKDAIIIREYKIPELGLKEPEKLKSVTAVKKKSLIKTAQVKLTTKIDIKRDELVKTPVPSVDDMAGKTISGETISGPPADGTLKTPGSVDTGSSNGTVSTEPPAIFIPQERSAEFPGGPNALQQFLSRHLRTPGDMEPGELITVKIRFRVDKNGSVNSLEIINSGGSEFDNEVVRVFKKMPSWMPAMQNGVNVPVNYMIPVTFVGPE
jgi:periplasmic protein TonB